MTKHETWAVILTRNMCMWNPFNGCYISASPGAMSPKSIEWNRYTEFLLVGIFTLNYRTTNKLIEGNNIPRREVALKDIVITLKHNALGSENCNELLIHKKKTHQAYKHSP